MMGTEVVWFEMMTTKISVYSGCMLFILSILSGCFEFHSEKKPEINEPIYARVNGVLLTESGLRSIVPRDFYDRLTPEHKHKIIEEWVNRELLYQEALHLKIDKTPEIDRLLLNSRRNLLSNELLEREIAHMSMPNEEKIEEVYEENREYFEIPTKEYRIRYALFDNKKDALEFRRRVKRNESFSDLAKEFSKDPSSQNGGNLGLVNEETIEPDIWVAVLSTVQNYGLKRVSDPFSVVDGWGCVIVDEEFEAGSIKPLKYVRDLVADMYMTEKREEVQKALLQRLENEADISIEFP